MSGAPINRCASRHHIHSLGALHAGASTQPSRHSHRQLSDCFQDRRHQRPPRDARLPNRMALSIDSIAVMPQRQLRHRCGRDRPARSKRQDSAKTLDFIASPFSATIPAVNLASSARVR